MAWQTPSRPNTLLFWSLVVLAVAMVMAVAFAIRGFNRDVSIMDGTASPQNTDGKTKDAPLPEGNALSQSKVLAGFVSGVISKEDSSEKWIELSVTTPESLPTNLLDTSAKRATITTTTKTATYRFYLGESVEGGKDITGGEQAIVSFFGEPSEKDYVGAEKIDVQKE